METKKETVIKAFKAAFPLTIPIFVCSEANINSDCLKPGNNKAFRQIFLSNFS